MIYPKKQHKAVVFLSLFTLFLVLEYFFFYLLSPHFVDMQCIATAKALYFILKFLGLPIVLTRDIIHIGKVSLRVVYECTGGFAFFIFSSATLAFPVAWSRRLIAQVIGIVGIFLLNTIRLVFIAYVAYRSPAAFDFIHKYLWQVTFPVVVILLFILWARKSKVE